MDGVRVSQISRELGVEDLKIHFSNKDNAGGRINKIYFPLLNNDAIIFFREYETVDLLLTRDHVIEGHRVHVVRTEPMIFSKISAKLSPEISSLVSVSKKIKAKLQYVIEVELEEDLADHSMILHGDMYQIELAWNTINQSLQAQHKIHSKIYQNQESWDGDRERTRSRSDSRSGIDGGTFTVQHDSLSSKMKLDSKVGRENQWEEPHRDVLRQNSSPYAPLNYQKEYSDRVVPNTSKQESLISTKGRTDKRDRDSLQPKKTGSDPRNRDSLTPSKTRSVREDDISDFLSKTSEPIVRPKTGSVVKPYKDLHETSVKKSDDEQTELELAYKQSEQRRVGQHLATSHDYENVGPSAYDSISRESNTYKPYVKECMLGEISDDMVDEEELQRIFKSSRGSSDSERSRQANDTFREFSSSIGSVYPFPRETTTGNTSFFSTDFSATSYQEFTIENLKVAVTLQNITAVETEGLVNAANGSLSHIGGVAGAISRAADVHLETECDDFIRKNGNLRTTEVMHTSAGGRLKVKYILHAVGPIWLESLPERCTWELIKTYLNCFEYANSTLRISSVSVPCISSGIFGVPLDTSVQCFVDAVLLYNDASRTKTKQYLREIYMAINDEDAVVTAIVIIQSLLEGGLDNSIQATKAKFKKLREKSGVSNNNYTNEYSSPRSLTGGRVRRTSSLDRRPNKAKVDRHEFKTATFRMESQKSPAVSKKSSATSNEAKKSTKSPVVKQTLTNPTSLRPKTSPSKAEKSRTDDVMRSMSDLGFQDDFDGMASLPAHLSYPNRDDNCPICIDRMRLPKTLDKCGHKFCQRCIDRHFNSGKPVCPTCGMLYGIVKGDQPLATMSFKIDKHLHLPGYEGSGGTIVIQYDVPAGLQMPSHPNPGKRYKQLKRTAYLPNNTEGQQVYKLLRKAFDNKLIFTIGASRTTGKEDVVTWNDIHHKTSVDGGPTKFGYPDPTYLNRVREELAVKGIV